MKRLLSLLPVLCVTLTSTLVCAQENPQSIASDTNLVVTATRMHKDGQAYYELHATGIVRASPQQTWRVLTTYADMHKFVPNLASTKLLSHTERESVIEQKWVKSVFFFTHTVKLVVRATEHPASGIDIALISGDVKQYSAHWEIMPLESANANGLSGTRITYDGKIAPDAYMPPFFGTSFMLSDLKEMMNAVLQEIDKPISTNSASALGTLQEK